MKVKNRLQLNTSIVLILFLMHIAASFIFYSQISDRLSRLFSLQTLEESVLELEININEHARAVFYYVGFPEDSTLEIMKDSQDDMRRYLEEFSSDSKLKIKSESLTKIIELTFDQEKNGNLIASLARQHHSLINRFRVKARSIDEMIDEKFQAAIQNIDPEVNIKHQAALDMEVNIDEAFAAIEGYALESSPELKPLLADAKSDFDHYVARYRDTTNTTEEKMLLNLIEKNFYAALNDGNNIIETKDALNAQLKHFEKTLNQIDSILDEEAQILLHEEYLDKSEEIENLVKTVSIVIVSISFLIILVVISVSIRISRGIVRGVEKLWEGFSQFGRRNLDFRIDIEEGNNDELNVLATKFNEMADSLKNTTISRDALIEEITIRKAVEAALETSRTRFAGILDIAQDAIVSVDETHEIIIFNKGAEHIFGYKEKEILGKSVNILLPENLRKNHHKLMNIFAESNTATQSVNPKKELTARRKDGVIFFAEATISKLLSNGVTILTIIMRDISDRKYVEKQLREHSQLLEQAVEEKTQEMQLMSDRLVRQEKLATIGKISGNIAHELRNPLGVINQSVFFLNRLISRGRLEAFNEKVVRSLSLIESELGVANTVITNLLDATRSNPIKRRQTDFKKLVLKVKYSSELFSNLEIDFQLDPNPFLIMVDSDRFQQVIRNLLMNALQANTQDLRVTVGGSLLTDNNSARIWIEDNGSGIGTNSIDQVFEPLYTTREMGTGLGLSICRQIVNAHSGSITIASSSDHGTTVEILLPIGNTVEDD